jgi:hypothetical protein
VQAQDLVAEVSDLVIHGRIGSWSSETCRTARNSDGAPCRPARNRDAPGLAQHLDEEPPLGGGDLRQHRLVRMLPIVLPQRPSGERYSGDVQQQSDDGGGPHEVKASDGHNRSLGSNVALVTEIPADVTIQWPVGPTYTEWVASEGSRAWVMYKLRSADWFIDTLETVGADVGYARYVGVEMALDGSLAALCGAFDAAVGGLIRATEMYADQRAKDGGMDPPPNLEPRRYKWSACKKKVSALRSDVTTVDVGALVFDIDCALTREPEPLGWLTEVQRRRNAAIHEDTLPRHIDVVAGGNAQADWRISVEGRGEHPVEYLRGVRRQLTALTEAMITVADHLCPNGVPTSRPVQGRP